MKTKRWAILVFICAVSVIWFVGLAEAANGSLKVVFKYKDPTTQAESVLSNAFVYLHSATKPPPLEKYFSKADYIGSSYTTYANGTPILQDNIPEGTYYIRVTQRSNMPPTSTNKLGPPQSGDLTWMQTAPITIVANQTTNLGTVYATPFGPAPITITGTVKNSRGVPLTGRYVRAQTTPCYDDGYNGNLNQCGPVKDLALQPTDANGKYTLLLRDPGTYYIYTSTCITADYDQYTGNRCRYEPAPTNPVTVKIRDTKTVNLISGY